MSLHQYIGARYVPVFYQNSLDPNSTLWENNVTYEPLTWVSSLNGNMYISKKTVPATAGDPASTPEYWMEAGQFNAYIRNLQNQIDALDTSLTANINLTNNIADNYAHDMKDRVFLFLGDSYDVVTSYLTKIGNAIKCKSFTKRSYTGAGFYKYNSAYDNYTYYNIITSIDPLTTAEINTITDVCFCIAVGNDNPQTNQNLVDAIVQMDTYLRATIPNLRNIYLIPVGWCSKSSSIQQKIDSNLNIYSHNVMKYGWHYIDCTRVMRMGYFLSSDDSTGYHPDNTAGEYMSQCVANAIVTGSCSWQFAGGAPFEYTPTMPAAWPNGVVTYPATGKINIISTVDSQGHIRINFDSLPIMIEHCDIASGNNSYDILLSRSDNKMPIPVNHNVMYPFEIIGDPSIVAAALINRSDDSLRIRIWSYSASAINDTTIQLLPSKYLIF